MEKWLARGAMAYCWMVIFAGNPLWIMYAFAIWHFLRLERTFVYIERIRGQNDSNTRT